MTTVNNKMDKTTRIGGNTVSDKTNLTSAQLLCGALHMMNYNISVEACALIIDTYLKTCEVGEKFSLKDAIELRTNHPDVIEAIKVSGNERLELQQQLAALTQQRDEAVRLLKRIGATYHTLSPTGIDINTFIASLTPMSKEGDKIDTKTGYVASLTTVEPTDKQP